MMKKSKRKSGRPTLFKNEYCDQAYKLCLLGTIDNELADFFNIDVATLNRWKVAHPEFRESLKKGKQIADSDIALKLYERAKGYECVEEIKMTDGNIVPITKRYPPDTTAAIFWLKNRQSKYWRDKVENEIPNETDNTVIIE